MKQIQKSCFVLMPFNKVYDIVYDCIKSAAVEKRIACSRDDKGPQSGLIMDHILKSIMEADFVIVDASEFNPNVIYELGFAHTLNKPSILLTREKGRPPFNLAQRAFLKYNLHALKDKGQFVSLANQISREIDGVLECREPEAHNNPISGSLRAMDYKLFRWENKWLWGYEKSYAEEKKAKAIFAACRKLKFEEMDPLYNKLIKNRTKRGVKSYMMLPDSPENRASEKFIMSLLEEDCKNPDRCFKILLLKKKDPFLFMGHGFFIYDPFLGKERAYMMEPMASDIQEDDADDKIRLSIEEGRSCQMANLEEHTFDIHLQSQEMVRNLTNNFVTVWNQFAPKKKGWEITGKGSVYDFYKRRIHD